ncbi:hypothetical protein NDU88_001210 [Pleurodeles waltl]|uniref:Uncharacterized protein n=1 Tax=Pleurodeles waltl TaxID=8319 RepID=A0AAV7R8D9_PLEWA|nr:hypothetical protein NDU88_001210 [Pleurodeles waltl]
MRGKDGEGIISDNCMNLQIKADQKDLDCILMFMWSLRRETRITQFLVTVRMALDLAVVQSVLLAVLNDLCMGFDADSVRALVPFKIAAAFNAVDSTLRISHLEENMLAGVHCLGLAGFHQTMGFHLDEQPLAEAQLGQNGE